MYHVYGRNAVMGPLETQTSSVHELGIMGEVVAPTKERSHAIANNARTSILHMPYEGQLATTGNFASPLSPHEQDAGEVFKFSVYHLIDLEPGEEASLFPIAVKQFQSSLPTPKRSVKLSEAEIQTLEQTKLLPIVKKQVPVGETTIQHVAKVVRSKNSGPFELTLDIMFDDEAVYERVQKADLLTNSVVKRLYQVSDAEIITNMYFDPALAWKCTLKRPWAQGSVGERDTLGTQQHAPLLSIKVPAQSHRRSKRR